ncbi:LacI family DNA-binding transcriptional regulator [Acidisoma cellulosilytica]|uniref:LacI family DNA-binding transcriptional regulator n=1 Tax=Acidisoma cellulosilyticum TaxID=2802395 RepID=A0A964E513_9PROT|nr:LacI family DNA-binding transcriptional regulator [Acidisoma cellulosilyticum]MCB8882061.1 LacI family DNA-binding transcriptional regulator [Acidisoma cellulosilyticum]
MRALADSIGVDRATISRALSTDKAHLVAPATRDLIRAAAAAAGYRADLMAATLRRGRSDTVGILVSDMMNEVLVRVMREIVTDLNRDQTRGQELTPLIAETGDGSGHIGHFLRTFLSRRVDAIICLSATEDDAEALQAAAREVPVVLAVRSISAIDLPSATCDDGAGGALVARHFLAHHHRVVCQIQGPQTATTFRNRAAGFSVVCREAGVRELSIGTSARAAISSEGRAVAEAILATPDRPTAVFAHNDSMALGFIEAMRHQGLAYPDDIAIVGFNNTELSRVLARPMSTVEYPVAKVSGHAADLVRALIKNREFSWESKSFDPQLVDRGTGVKRPA